MVTKVWSPEVENNNAWLKGDDIKIKEIIEKIKKEHKEEIGIIEETIENIKYDHREEIKNNEAIIRKIKQDHRGEIEKINKDKKLQKYKD